MKELIAYTSFADDGTVRIALHPMDISPPFGVAACNQRWSFRVIDTSGNYDCRWHTSCRGKDYGATGEGDRYVFKFEENAFRWLFAGEEQ